MKTGEEKFDDEIRQKLRYSEVIPPPGIFDKIVPPPENKKGFLWLWMAGVILLVITAGLIRFMPVKILSGNESRNTFPVKNHTETSVKSSHAYNNRKADESNITGNNSVTENTSGNTNKLSGPGDSGNDPSKKINIDKRKRTEQISVAGPYVTGSNSSPNKKSGSDKSQVKEIDSKQSTGRIFVYDDIYVPLPSLPYSGNTENKQIIRIIKPGNKHFEDHQPSRYALEAGYSKLFYTPDKSVTSKDSLSERLINSYDQTSPNNSAYQINARLLYALNKKFTIKAGMGYHNSHQEFEFPFTEFYKQLNIDTITYFILFPFAPPLQVTTYDSTIETLSRNHIIKHDLTLHVITVSAGLTYNFPLGRFLIEPGITLSADLLSTASGKTNFSVDFMDQAEDDYYKKRTGFNIAGQIQAGYSLNERITICIQSGYLYGLREMKTTKPFYKEKTNSLSAGVSLRYNFFRSQAAKIPAKGSDIVSN